jgi:hypothetical protein
MICERCGTVFCWDEADEGTLCGVRRRYCSKTCRARAARDRSRKHTRTRRALAACTDKAKHWYEDERDALLAAARYERLHGERRYPYECPCGTWHLTSEPPDHRQKADAIKLALFGSVKGIGL